MKKLVIIILVSVFLFISTITFAGNQKPLAVPGGLTAMTQSTSQINIKWSAATGDLSFIGYKVFRNGEQVSTVTNSTSFCDTGLSVGTIYSYSLSAYDAAGNNTSQCPPVVASTLSYINNGSGLRGEYYDNIDFTNLIQTRIDPYIDFNWGMGVPNSSMGTNAFSIRWSGQILPLYSEEYTFHTVSDDGIVLFINGTKIIDSWREQNRTENRGKIRLVAGQKVDIKLEYFENKGHSSVKLYWSGKSQLKHIIPQSQLFSNVNDIIAPTVPSGLIAEPFSTSRINLNWSPSVDNSGVVGYKVFRNGAQVGAVVNMTNYPDTGLTATTGYLYTICAYDAAGNNSHQCDDVYAETH